MTFSTKTENPLIQNVRARQKSVHTITFDHHEMQELRARLKLRPDDSLPKTGSELLDALRLAEAKVLHPSISLSGASESSNPLVAGAEKMAAAAGRASQ